LPDDTRVVFSREIAAGCTHLVSLDLATMVETTGDGRLHGDRRRWRVRTRLTITASGTTNTNSHAINTTLTPECHEYVPKDE
jgi:hypothetical protein